jgi:hypothetical protein
MVLLPDGNLPDPGRNSYALSKEGTTAWNNFFKPQKASDTVSVPYVWVDFLTSKLMTPDDYACAKNLLQSDVWRIITQHYDMETREFCLHGLCPASAPPVCALSEACKDIKMGFSTP